MLPVRTGPAAPPAIVIADVPELPEAPGSGWWAAILPVLGGAGMAGYAVLSGRVVFIVLALGGVGCGLAASLLTRGAQQRRWRRSCHGLAQRYCDHLEACRLAAERAAGRQRQLLAGPPPSSTWVHLGLGRVPLDPPLQGPRADSPLRQPEPGLLQAARELVRNHSAVEDCPIGLDLARSGPLCVVGASDRASGYVRALLRQLSPADVQFVDGCALPAHLASAPAAAALVHVGRRSDVPAWANAVAVVRPDGSVLLTIGPEPTAGAMSQVVARPVNPPDEPWAPLDSCWLPGGLASEHPAAAPGALLEVRLGTDRRGRQVTLDLAEAADGGDGPHGWIVGATGTGKSQVLRRLVVGLADHRSPDDVAFVLVDFKGGATFDDLTGLPHVAGFATNLDGSGATATGADGGAGRLAVTRLVAGLRAELRHRQQVLRDAGAPDIRTLRAGAPKAGPALPHLVVIIDEVTELLTEHPDVLDLLATIGRIGRSLGVHLVLAAQRPDEARLRSLEGALRFRLCLRTLTDADSVAVLGTSAAAALPAEPGWALLGAAGGPRAFRVTPVPLRPAAPAVATATARRVWHPPLPLTVERAPLPTSVAGQEPAGQEPAGRQVPIGLADAPELSWQGPISLLLDGAAGHVGIVGAPRSGRTTALRLLGYGLADPAGPAAAAAAAAHVYAIGLAGGLHSLQRLTTVGGVAGPADTDLALDIVGTVLSEMSERRAAGAGDRAERPDIFLLIDDWPLALDRLPELAPAVADIAAGGLDVGVHLILAAHRWSQLRANLRDCLGTRLELHLPDGLESLAPRDLPRPASDVPGRAVLLTGTACTGTALLPLPTTVQLARRAPASTAPAVPRLRAAVPAPLRITSLPHRVVDDPQAPGPLPLGVSSAGPVALALGAADPHVLIVGDPGSGRSTALGTLLRGVSRRQADPFRVLVVDPRGTVDVGRPHRRATAGPEIVMLLDALITELRQRPNAGRRGPARTVLAVDDLDLAMALTGPVPWSELAALLPLAADAGLAMLASRRCAGIARAAYDPVLLALRESRTTGLLLSGSPEEGSVFGDCRPRRLPPGRGLLVRADAGPRLVQIYAPADLDPAHDDIAKGTEAGEITTASTASGF